MSNKDSLRVITDILPIALRAYVEPIEDAQARSGAGSRRNRAGPSEWSLCFDVETTTDPAQRSRVGAFQVRRNGELYQHGLFYDPDVFSEEGKGMLRAWAAKHNASLLTISEFIEEVFFGIGYDLRATILGFNQPFDISRLAIGWASARLDMRDGFTFKLSRRKFRPRVQVKHISRRLSFNRFAATAGQRAWRSERRRDERIPVRRGFFVDVKTIAGALLAKSGTLQELGKFLRTPTQKEASDEHGGPITEKYLDYVMGDVQLTWECFRDLASRYAKLGLMRTPLHSIYSEASVGKAMMVEMGLRPWRAVQRDFPNELLGRIWSTYFGGRAEVSVRRVVMRVRYCDFLSMYPTVCTLQGLWEFMRAEGVDSRDATAEVTEFLANVSLDDFQCQPIWGNLAAIVEVLPDDEVYPVRAPYQGGGQCTIGLNHISKGPTLWFTLAECVAAKLHTGRSPKVVRAVGFSPRRIQKGLRPILIAGNPAYRIDPRKEDPFKRLIELRQDTKIRRDAANGVYYETLDAEQNQLKILANSTSYGCYAEVNVESSAGSVDALCFGSSGDPYQVCTRQVEKPGIYYHPLMATLITAGARLMLTIAERLAAREGLDWVFCDTDSIALVKPEGMSDDEFNRKADAVQQWFVPLNPYDFGGPLLQTEKHNYGLHKGKPTRDLEPLYCLAISSKRYALFNIDGKGRPVLRKASAHGLGHLLAPYPDDKATRGIPAPSTKLSDIGVRRWEHDFWNRIVLAALEGHPDTVDLSGFRGFDQPAASQYAATTPELLRLFDKHNQGRPTHDQVRPFNFLLAFQAKPCVGSTNGANAFHLCASQRTKSVQVPRPVAAYSKDLSKAAECCFDRDTGERVERRQLKTYREALATYHLHPELKFLNGDWTDRGKVQRRHVEVVGIVNIGKEANELEEQFYLGADPEAMPEYGMAPNGRAETLGRIAAAARRFGRRQLAEAAGISLRTLSSILGVKCRPTEITIARLLRGISKSEAIVDDRGRAAAEAIASVRARAQSIGLRRLAAEIGVDAANLAKILAGSRIPSRRILAQFITEKASRSAAYTRSG